MDELERKLDEMENVEGGVEELTEMLEVLYAFLHPSTLALMVYADCSPPMFYELVLL